MIVHEWTDRHWSRDRPAPRHGGRFTLLFHDTHHRAVSRQAEIGALDLDDYDGVLAFGDGAQRSAIGRAAGAGGCGPGTRRPTRGCSTRIPDAADRDLVWIGNWGDDERSAELAEFLIEPVGPAARARARRALSGSGASRQLAAAGIAYGGWLPNARVPQAFARHRVTVHVPRRPYVAALPGIPTIRVFEALACGIPLVSAPWDDTEGLFRPGTDYLVARMATRSRAGSPLLLTDRPCGRARGQRARDDPGPSHLRATASTSCSPSGGCSGGPPACAGRRRA